MKILGILAFLAVLVIGVVLISGCVQKPEEKPPVTTPSVEGPAETPTGESLSDLLGKVKGITSVKYDMVMTSPGTPPVTQKVWLKKNKMRTEMTMEGQTVVNLIDTDAKTMYMYMPAQNMAMKMDSSKAPGAPTKNIEEYKPVVIGTETLDGKVCQVVEYTVEGVKTKSWIWKERGFPIRMEMTTPEGKVIIEYKNIEFVDISDSMFELPAGVEIMEMPGGAP